MESSKRLVYLKPYLNWEKTQAFEINQGGLLFKQIHYDEQISDSYIENTQTHTHTQACTHTHRENGRVTYYMNKICQVKWILVYYMTQLWMIFA